MPHDVSFVPIALQQIYRDSQGWDSSGNDIMRAQTGGRCESRNR